MAVCVGVEGARVKRIAEPFSGSRKLFSLAYRSR